MVMACSASLLSQTLKKEKVNGREAVAGEVIVRFKPSSALSARSAGAFDSTISSARELGKTGAILLHSDGRSSADLLRAYASRSDVEYAEPNYIWHKSDIPSDPSFAQQWYLRNTGQSVGGQLGIANVDIHAVPAWDITLGTRDVVVGVIDSGVDYNHPDLIANLWTAPFSFSVNVKGQSITCAAGTHGFNTINESCDPLDDEGHGTAVSGIIGAAGNNAIGIAGISRITTILPLKFLDSTGSGSTSNAVEAIEFAIQLKLTIGLNIRVLNASWGSNGFSQALLDEINAANSNDMLIAAAAGNETANNDAVPSYPANYTAPNVISVAATDNRDGLASFSNFGAATVHLGAPGVAIETTLRSGQYGLVDGTSAAVPMVAGAAALVLAACPIPTATLKATLLGTVNPVNSLSGRTITGGRLNVGAAIGACTGITSPSFNLSADSNLHIVGPSSTQTINIQITPIGGFTAGVHFTAGNLPTGVAASFSNDNVAGANSSTLTLTAGSFNSSFGQNSIKVTGTSGSIIQVINIPILLIEKFFPGQKVNGTLNSSSVRSPENPGSFANFGQLALTTTTSVSINMRSTEIDPFLYLRANDGTVLNFDDDSGGGLNARIGPVILPPGIYQIEATSADENDIGSYTLSLNLPSLDSITPNSVRAGTSVNVTLKGDRFLPPATISNANFTVSNLTVADPQTITAIFSAAKTTVTGVRNIDVFTSEGHSNSLPFSITPAFPELTAITPVLGIPGTTAPARLDGFGFTSGMTINTDGDIAVTISNNVDTFANLQLTISANAALGPHSISFTTALGTSNTLTFTVINQPPVITSITPNSGIVGAFFSVTVTGNNFVSPLVFNVGGGVTFGTPTVTPTQVTTTFQISASATLGPRDFTISSAAGVSAPVTFTVLPVPVVLVSITPNTVGQGSTLDVNLFGSGFQSPMAVDAGPGILATNLVINSATSAKVTLAISATAAMGPRDFTLTTIANTSAPKTLTVIAPFSDMTISVSRDPAGFGVGFNETYSIVITNAGSVATTAPTTLTYDFTAGVGAFASGSGTGFTCTSTTSSRAVCTHASSIEPGGQRNLTLTVTPITNNTTTNLANFTVATTGDNGTANNSVSDSTPVKILPRLTLAVNPSGGIGVQQTATLTTTTSFPHNLSGTITLGFVSNTTVPANDPAIQFAAGGRQLAITLAANSTQLLIAGGTSSMAFQDGTVAGTLTLSATLQSPGTVQPSAITPVNIVISPAVPTIQSVAKDTQSGFAFVITLISDTREISSVTFAFSTPASTFFKSSFGVL